MRPPICADKSASMGKYPAYIDKSISAGELNNRHY